MFLESKMWQNLLIKCIVRRAATLAVKCELYFRSEGMHYLLNNRMAMMNLMWWLHWGRCVYFHRWNFVYCRVMTAVWIAFNGTIRERKCFMGFLTVSWIFLSYASFFWILFVASYVIYFAVELSNSLICDCWKIDCEVNFLVEYILGKFN